MSRLVLGCMLTTFVLGTTRDAVGQRRATPNAAPTTPATPATPLDDATRVEVLAARDAIWRAWFAHDTAALQRLLPRSTTAGEGGGWETRDEIIAGSRHSATSGQRLVGIRFDETRLHANGDVVVVFSRYTLELERDGRRNTITGNASEVFVRRDGVWQNPFWYLVTR